MNKHGCFSIAFWLCATGVVSILPACDTNTPAGVPPYSRPVLGGIDPSVFPKDFMWGAASSAHQVEGNDVDSDWWAWEQQGKTEGGPSGDAADQWDLYEQDFDRLVDLHLDTYRLSLSWARLFPRAGMTEPDPVAVAHYDAVFAALAARKIRPMVSLHHFVMPEWLTAADRWASGDAIDDFKQLAEFAAHRWGKYVDWWITVNEPEVFVFHGWWRGLFPPGKNDLLLAGKVLINLMKAHAEAYHIIHEVDRVDADGDGVPANVGIAHLIVPVQAYSAWNPVEQAVATAIGGFSNSFWFLADRTGVLNLQLPGGPDLQENYPLFRGTLDFIGVNYYSRQIWRLDPLMGLVIDHYPGSVLSSLGVEVYPQGLYDSLKFLSQFKLPMIITENGIADETDKLRGNYIRDHLAELSRFMHDHPDSPVLGYVHWALTDNFEWEHGFVPRFGLYAVDYATQERTRRPSADTFSQIINTIKSGG